MSENEQVDVIIVGGGLAGLSCAYMLAKAGKEVVVIERGASCGEKNMTGGRVYIYSLLEMFGKDMLKEAPFERVIVKEQIVMVNGKASTTIDYTDYGFEDVPQSYSLLHAVFDPWLAEQAENAGAMIANGVLVEDLIEKDGKIVGVKTNEDEMYADLVIAADGVNSFMAQKAGIRDDLKLKELGIGVKEVIELPEETIAERFGLSGNEGAARLYVGAVPGVSGGCSLYTNRNSISVGMVLNPKSISEQKESLHELMQDFKMNPAVQPFIEGGKTVEYSAHLVSEGGYHDALQTPYRAGLLVIGDAAGFVINMGNTIRGCDLAIASGMAAAKAYITDSNSDTVGPMYKKELEKVIFPTMKIYAGFPKVMELQRMYTAYPMLANKIMESLFSVDGTIPEKMPKVIMKTIKQGCGFSALIADGWKAVKSL